MSLLLFMAAATVAAPRQDFTEDQRRRMLAEFATCAVSRRPGAISDVVLSQRESEQALRGHLDLLPSDCMPFDENVEGLTMSTPGPLMRYALADALIRKNPSLKLGDLSLIAHLDHGSVPRRGSQEEEKRAASGIAVSRYGECVVRTAPVGAEQLVRSGIATPQEDSAFAVLTPALSNCLFQGQTGMFSREVLRGTIALNYYRLAKAPRSAPAKVARQ